MTKLSQILNHLEDFFKGDEDKIISWLVEKNPAFGGISPWQLISAGRAHKVLFFVENAIQENKRPEQK